MVIKRVRNGTALTKLFIRRILFLGIWECPWNFEMKTDGNRSTIKCIAHPLYPLWTTDLWTGRTCLVDSDLLRSYMPATTLVFPNFMTQWPAVKMTFLLMMEPPHEWLYGNRGGNPHWTETWYGNSPGAAGTPSVMRGCSLVGTAQQTVKNRINDDRLTPRK